MNVLIFERLCTMLESNAISAPGMGFSESKRDTSDPVASSRPVESCSDESLVIRSRKGDRIAFEELIRRTSRLVYAHLLLEIGDQHRAEDLVQETYLNAFRAIEKMTDASGFRPWLLKIAHSALVDFMRRSARKKRAGKHAAPETLNQIPSESPDPARELEQSEARQRALDILRTLPEEYRQPLMLRYLGGADYDTIGKQLGLTHGSLRGLLSRGLALLRAEFMKDSES
jgi:RNA polymerase sigma-70 factor (ECF subfamily)